jgi:hypothetical protein
MRLLVIILIALAACRLDAAATHEEWTWKRGKAPSALPFSPVWDSVDGGFLMLESPFGANGTALDQQGLCLYLPKSDEWRHVEAANAPAPRMNAPTAWDEKRRVLWLYAKAITDYDAKKPTELWKFDPAAKSWEQVEFAGASPPSRFGAALRYWRGGDRLVVVGGFGQDTARLRRDDLWTFDPEARVWSRSPVAAPSRGLAAAAIDEQRGMLVVQGGCETVVAGRTVTHPPMSDAFVYDLAAKKPSWKTIARSPAPLSCQAAAWDETRSRLLLFGGRLGEGEAAKTSGDLIALDAKGSWSVASAATPCGPRSLAGMARCPDDGSLFIIGGSGPPIPGSDHAQMPPLEPWIGIPAAH